jgi:hypothetical protein
MPQAIRSQTLRATPGCTSGLGYPQNDLSISIGYSKLFGAISVMRFSTGNFSYCSARRQFGPFDKHDDDFIERALAESGDAY